MCSNISRPINIKPRNFPDVYWREFVNGYIPTDAVLFESELYVGQIPIVGILPGTIYPNKNSVVTVYCGKKLETANGVKILCSNHYQNLKWEYVNTGCSKENSSSLVRGGFENGEVLYIGKVFHEGQWKIGKVYSPYSPHRGGLRLWTNAGGVYVTQDFEILKYID